MKLSDRVRPDVEAAPWVIEEIKQLEAERDAAVALLREVNERFIYKGRGATHWEGCEESHPDCAMAKRIEAIIDTARSKT